MTTKEFSIAGDVNIEKIWGLYSDVNFWKKWDLDIKETHINGEFCNGTTGVIVLKDNTEVPFKLENVEKNKSFSVIAFIGPFKVEFIHLLAKDIVHKIVVNGPDSGSEKKILEELSRNIPEALKKLLDLSNIVN